MAKAWENMAKRRTDSLFTTQRCMRRGSSVCQSMRRPDPDPVSLVDLMPTVLGAVGLEIPSEVQGRSLLPELRADKTNRDRTLYGETFLPRIHFNWSELRGSENIKYHFIEAPGPELYDLAKDPGEVHNLFTEKKAVAEEMRAKLVSLIRDYGAGKELAEKTGLDPALMERLKALGYAGFSGGRGHA